MAPTAITRLGPPAVRFSKFPPSEAVHTKFLDIYLALPPYEDDLFDSVDGLRNACVDFAKSEGYVGVTRSLFSMPIFTWGNSIYLPPAWLPIPLAAISHMGHIYPRLAAISVGPGPYHDAVTNSRATSYLATVS